MSSPRPISSQSNLCNQYPWTHALGSRRWFGSILGQERHRDLGTRQGVAFRLLVCCNRRRCWCVPEALHGCKRLGAQRWSAQPTDAKFELDLNWKTFDERTMDFCQGITLHHLPGHTDGLVGMQINLQNSGTFFFISDHCHVIENVSYSCLKR